MEPSFISMAQSFMGEMKKILEILDMVLGRIAKFNFRLKPSKYSFGMTSVEFWGTSLMNMECI